MTATTVNSRTHRRTRQTPWPWISLGALGVWFASALGLAAEGSLTVPPAGAPVPVLLGVAIPVGVFLAAYGASAGFRRFILSLDLRTVVAFQAWRVLGAMFLVLLAFGHLPGFFAWPAGIGDVAIGVAAIWILHRLVQRPATAASYGFLWFNLLGIFDFVVAFATGFLSRNASFSAEAAASSNIMGDLPLILIPGFAVPLFTILHLIAILHWRQARRA